MVASLLSEAWRIYRERFGLIVAVVVVVWLPCEFLSSYLDVTAFHENPRLSFKFSQFLDNFIGIIATAAVTFVAFTSTVRSDQPAAFGDTMNESLSAWGRLWWTRFLSGLAIILGLLLLIVPGLYLIVRLAFVENVAVIERLSGSDAIRRSFELTTERFWPTCRLVLAVMLCILVPVFSIGFTQGLVPALDHWIIEATSNLACDIVAAFGTVALVCGYQKFSEVSPSSSEADS